ncbi:right-handed parallel beta-helix repeat-containing protein [Desulfovibrio inopinatus]|uniref:right-handed parallel beta-helix repeat-containing protein n=1 Tax=Desulfovibrio inopinatus TaxID=102109 RepID=UPI0003F69F2C|nr:right-handed parallel beta-helix repeat-containing protein [Desulfovibrio inopinatus]
MLIKFIMASILSLFCCIPAYAIVVSNATALEEAVAAAHEGGDRSIFLENGQYTLSGPLVVRVDNVTVRSLSGDRDNVTVFGNGMNGTISHVFLVYADGFHLHDVTIGKVAYHGVQFQPGASLAVLQNLRIIDCREQMVKGAYDSSQPDIVSRESIIENCLFEYTAGIGPQSYIGGIDVHAGVDWIVRGNTFKNIKSPSGSLAEHAVHFWSGASGTLVENNIIINCDRGIGFGLGDRGHVNGIIRNNMIVHDGSGSFADVSIGLESAEGAVVVQNSIYMASSYPNAIEYRFTTTKNVLLANNLTNRAIVSRDGGEASVSDNLTTAQADWFVDLSSGDLHLVSAVDSVVGAAPLLSQAPQDFDGQLRQNPTDIGADTMTTLPDLGYVLLLLLDS